MAGNSRGNHQVKPGVWVTLAEDGSYQCRVHRCTEAPESLEPTHRGLCAKHYVTYADNRPKCRVCRARYAVAPLVDEMCEECHPAHKELLPYEAQVLEAVRRKENPVGVLQEAMGPGTSVTTARNQYKRMSRHAGTLKRIRLAFKGVGITEQYLLENLRDTLQAEKVTIDKNGEEHFSPDHRARNTARDQAFKLMGAYPQKEREQTGGDKQQVNVAVAVIPSIQPRPVDAPIYTLPVKEQRESEE